MKKEPPARRDAGSDQATLPQQPSSAAPSQPAKKPVKLNRGLHAVLKAKAARGGGPLEALVENIIVGALDPADLREARRAGYEEPVAA